MKKTLLITSLWGVIAQLGLAQTLVVNPGPAGTLNQAIANNPSITTFILKRDFPYLLSGELNISSPITIKAEPGPGKRPILLYAPPSGAPNIDQIIRTSANLRLEGLHLTNRDNLAGISQRMIRTTADNLRIETHDCIFDDSGQTAFRLDGKNNKIYVTNCYASRMGQPNNPDNGRFIDDRGNDVDSVVIENSAIYNVTSRIYRNGGSLVNYMRIEGSTFMNSMQRGFEVLKVREFVFLNNICADLHINGRDSSLVPDNNETNINKAWIRIDSTGSGGEKWTIGYSNFFYTPTQIDYYKFPFVNDNDDTVTVVSFFNPNALKAIEAGGWGNTIISEPLSFINPPVFPRSIIDTFNFGANDNAMPWDMSGLTPDPIYSQLPVGTSRYSTLHNFNYTCDAQSNTAGVNGTRLGAMLWGDCLVSINDLFDQHNVLFYPNPANDMVYITGLTKITRVQLFDVRGRLLRSLSPASDWLEMPLQGLANGIYFINLVDEKGQVSTRQLVKQ